MNKTYTKRLTTNNKIHYVATINEYAPEQSVMQKVKYNAFHDGYTVLETAPLHDGYFYYTKKYDITKRLTKEFFRFCKGTYKIPTTYRNEQNFYISISKGEHKGKNIFVHGYTFQFCNVGFGVYKMEKRWVLTHFKSGASFGAFKTKKEIEKQMDKFLNFLDDQPEHMQKLIERFKSSENTNILLKSDGTYENA